MDSKAERPTGLGRLLLSAVEMYRSSAIATLPPAEFARYHND